MPRRYPMPAGAIVQDNGMPTPIGRAYLVGLDNINSAVNDIANLDDGTTYTADELRDKLIELITALQG